MNTTIPAAPNSAHTLADRVSFLKSCIVLNSINSKRVDVHDTRMLNVSSTAKRLSAAINPSDIPGYSNMDSAYKIRMHTAILANGDVNVTLKIESAPDSFTKFFDLYAQVFDRENTPTATELSRTYNLDPVAIEEAHNADTRACLANNTNKRMQNFHDTFEKNFAPVIINYIEYIKTTLKNLIKDLERSNINA